MDDIYVYKLFLFFLLKQDHLTQGCRLQVASPEVEHMRSWIICFILFFFHFGFIELFLYIFSFGYIEFFSVYTSGHCLWSVTSLPRSVL